MGRSAGGQSSRPDLLNARPVVDPCRVEIAIAVRGQSGRITGLSVLGPTVLIARAKLHALGRRSLGLRYRPREIFGLVPVRRP